MNLEDIDKLLEEIGNDRSVPRNIRTAIDEARNSLNNENQDLAIRINNAVFVLDEVSNDPNIPIYTRTQIWNIVSMLEVMDKTAKQVTR